MTVRVNKFVKDHDHDAIWLAELLEYRLGELSLRQKTLTIKLSVASALKLAHALRRDYQEQP